MPYSRIVSYKSFAAASAAGLMLLVTGCASSYGAGEITQAGVGESATVRQGYVSSVRPVRIAAGNTNKVIGTVVGAAIGGIAGSQVGGGKEENAVGAIVGATAGGVIGNEVAKGANTRAGYAYVIDFGDGKLVEITQGADVYIEPGTRVNVAYYSDRVRISPAQY